MLTSEAATVIITVNPVNDAPTSNALSAIIDEDEDAVITLDGNDIDGDVLSYILVQDSPDGFVDIVGSVATFTPDDNYNGTTSFTYLVTDGELASSSSTVTIVVNAVNDTPVLSAIEDQSIDEDTVLSLTLSADDIDGDALTYSASIDGNGDVSVVDNQLTITPDEDYNGNIVVDISVSDGQYIDTDSFILTVNPVNDAPVLSAVEDQSIDEDTILSLTLVANDVDGDALTSVSYTHLTLPTILLV